MARLFTLVSRNPPKSRVAIGRIPTLTPSTPTIRTEIHARTGRAVSPHSEPLPGKTVTTGTDDTPGPRESVQHFRFGMFLARGEI